MKKILISITAMLILVTAGCSAENQESNNQQTVANPDKVLQEMAEGITERLNIPEQNSDDLSDEDAKAYYSELVKCELDRLLKYEDCTFEDEKLNDLLHTYIDSCKAQSLAIDYYTNDELFDALWEGGRTTRAGVIVELYENYDLPISKEQVDSYRTEYTITYETDIDDLIPSDNTDVVLKNGDLSIVSGEGTLDDNFFDYKFVVKNNSDYELKTIAVNCSICDKDGNIVKTDSEYLYATVLSGKQATIEGSINKDDLENASYIIVDSFTYDGNGDNKVYTLDVNTDNAQKTKIAISQNNHNSATSPSITAGVVTETSDEEIKEQSIEFDYEEFVSNSSKYADKYVKLEGQILAKQATGTAVLTFRIDTTPNSFSSEDKIVQVTYIDDNINESNYKLGDTVTIYGKFTETGTYPADSGEEVSLPKISADIVYVN